MTPFVDDSINKLFHIFIFLKEMLIKAQQIYLELKRTRAKTPGSGSHAKSKMTEMLMGVWSLVQ